MRAHNGSGWEKKTAKGWQRQFAVESASAIFIRYKKKIAASDTKLATNNNKISGWASANRKKLVATKRRRERVYYE